MSAVNTSGGVATTPPVSNLTTMQELIELEKETEKRVREIEKKLHSNETLYIQNTTLANPQTSSFFGGFGNLISGWEGLLEARSVDKKRASERIFSSSSESWLAHRREMDQKKKLDGGGGGGGGGDNDTSATSHKGGHDSGGGGGGGAAGGSSSHVDHTPVISAAELAKIAAQKALRRQKKAEKKARRALEAKNNQAAAAAAGGVSGIGIDALGSGSGGGGGEDDSDEGGVESTSMPLVGGEGVKSIGGGQKRPREEDPFNDMYSSTSLDGAAGDGSTHAAFEGFPSPSALMGQPMKKAPKTKK